MSKKIKHRQYTYNVPLRRVRVTILQWKSKNKFSVYCWATRHCRQYKILTVIQQCFYGELISPATMRRN